MSANLENSAVAIGLKKVSFHSNPRERQCQRMFKLLYNYAHFTCKIMLKTHQVRLQKYMNQELPDVQAGFRKDRGTRDQIVNIFLIIEKANEFQKNIYFCLIDYAKVFDCVDHNKLWKILKKLGIPDHLTYLCVQVRSNSLELDMEEWTVSEVGKGYNKAVCCHPAYLTSMQSASCEMLDWMNHKLESRSPGEISTTSNMQMIPL